MKGHSGHELRLTIWCGGSGRAADCAMNRQMSLAFLCVVPSIVFVKLTFFSSVLQIIFFLGGAESFQC